MNPLPAKPLPRILRDEAELRIRDSMEKLRTLNPSIHDVVQMLVNLDGPGDSAHTLMGTAISNNATSNWPEPVTRIVWALLCYQAHLDFEAGKVAAREEASS